MAKSAATTCFAFHQVNPEETKLFTVRPGVPASDALEAASCFMDVALSLCKGIGSLSDDDVRAGMACDLRQTAFASLFLLEMAKAVVDSIEVKA
ncbi:MULTISPECIES: DUF3077 domain-containing protein [Hydrocarboniphaga]|nr:MULTISPECIES: DUF3077 domain-containing protein [Hydrocarboniphaga]MDZ4077196.1 DUF3077 domain-containing protein [Hydrocarboniphaga sp.]